MDDKILQNAIQNKNVASVQQLLEQFNKQNSSVFDLSHLRVDNQWHTIWKLLFTILNEEQLAGAHSMALNAIRVLTRDAQSLEENNIALDCNCLLKLAHLCMSSATQMSPAPPPTPSATDTSDCSGPSAAAATTKRQNSLNEHNIPIIVEAVKCLCNLVYQSEDCRRQCVKNNAAEAILRRVAMTSSPVPAPASVELFDLKLLFLITALEKSTRTRLQIDLNGLAYMTEWLVDKLQLQQFSTEELELICEMLKVMFNISSCAEKSPDENEIQSLHLVGVLRKVLVRFGAMHSEGERSVITNTINLLTNIWGNCLSELIVKCSEPAGTQTEQLLSYEGFNVKAIEVILYYLLNLLNEQSSAAMALNELISPSLTVLIKCVRHSVLMRHYIRSVILPPLRDVSQRPEVGKELRNHLCRFLTLPDMVLRNLAAELLFICCKENVARMIKYTGFGNAAGLFANRGLLDCRQVENPIYSSDSEDSDTEEYRHVQHKVNPVLGCTERPKSNPFEGMSEEQKEYEAVKLANLMDQLHRTGIVQPARIGEDGRPQPVDHILQLQEELPSQQHQQKRKT